jgi:hypothetical protein
MKELSTKTIRLLIIYCIGFAVTVHAEQGLSVKWSNPKRTTVDIFVTHHDEDMEECALSGSDVYYRFEVQVCTRRKGWFDRCSDSVVATRALRLDPISETYTVSSDLFGDSLPSEKHAYSSKAEALLDLSGVNGIPAMIRSNENRKQFVNVRLKFTCKGQSSALLDRLSSIITLGIVPTGTADTGWQEFFIE